MRGSVCERDTERASERERERNRNSEGGREGGRESVAESVRKGKRERERERGPVLLQKLQAEVGNRTCSAPNPIPMRSNDGT